MEEVISEKKRKSSREIDMTSGRLFPKIVAFSLPLIATGVLQLLFNAADIIVVGQFVNDGAVAAIGATSTTVNLMINLFMGLAMGAGVLMSRYFGSKNGERCHELVHTAMPLSLILGLTIAVVGYFVSPHLLRLINTPEECIEQSTLYLKIYFIGSPFLMVYNFGAAILRAIGDTVRPLIFLTIAGVMNIIVNVVSVVVFDLGVAGVAYATITSQAVSAILVVITLIKENGVAKYIVKHSQISKRTLLEIVALGVPSGLQGTLFSISNLLIQSTINGFGELVVAANTAAVSLEGFVYIAMNAISHTSSTVVGQNYGAGDFDRIKKAALTCTIYSVALSLLISGTILLLQQQLLSLYLSTDEAIKWACIRLNIILPTYFVLGIMDLLSNSMRGMGSSVIPMILTLIGACLFRIAWIYTIFPLNPIYDNVILSFPASWIVTLIAFIIAFISLFNSKKRLFANSREDV